MSSASDPGGNQSSAVPPHVQTPDAATARPFSAHDNWLRYLAAEMRGQADVHDANNARQVLIEMRRLLQTQPFEYESDVLELLELFERRLEAIAHRNREVVPLVAAESTVEDEARAMLKRMGFCESGVDEMTTGDLVELANLIALRAEMDA